MKNLSDESYRACLLLGHYNGQSKVGVECQVSILTALFPEDIVFLVFRKDGDTTRANDLWIPAGRSLWTHLDGARSEVLSRLWEVR